MIERQSTITCPECGHSAIEIMPTDACQYIYDCKQCGKRMTPKKADCCVFLFLRLGAMSSDPRGTCRRQTRCLLRKR